MKIRPYILAGGKSSRMGRDKAMLELEGCTLLARAVQTLRSIEALQSQDGHVVVTLCGQREMLEGADRSIIDSYPSCGPLGGIEAALSDLSTSDAADWAFFIPLDVPLLSASLIRQLLTLWATEPSFSDRTNAFLTSMEGRPQPLVSLIHRSALGQVRNALDAGQYKVVPVLQSIGAHCTSIDQDPLTRDSNKESIGPLTHTPSNLSWVSTSRLVIDGLSQLNDRESLFSSIANQFINVNTEADLIKVATLLRYMGSNLQPERPAR